MWDLPAMLVHIPPCSYHIEHSLKRCLRLHYAAKDVTLVDDERRLTHIAKRILYNVMKRTIDIAKFGIAWCTQPDQIFVTACIPFVVQHHCKCLLAVAPCPAALLVIAFQRTGKIVMYDRTYIGLIDTHSESTRGDDHLHLALQELVLDPSAQIGRLTCMIRDCLDPLLCKLRNECLNSLACRGI